MSTRRRSAAGANDCCCRQRTVLRGGVHSVVDRVIDAPGVAKATLTGAFGRKDDSSAPIFAGRHAAPGSHDPRSRRATTPPGASRGVDIQGGPSPPGFRGAVHARRPRPVRKHDRGAAESTAPGSGHVVASPRRPTSPYPNVRRNNSSCSTTGRGCRMDGPRLRRAAAARAAATRPSTLTVA